MYIYVFYLVLKSEICVVVNVCDKELVFGRVFNFNICMIVMYD